MLTGLLRHVLRRPLTAVARWLGARGVAPWHVTLASPLLLWLVATPTLGWFSMAWGAVVAGAVLSLDALDGAIARTSSRASEWGHFCDLISDRFGDAALWTGVVVACHRRLMDTTLVLALVAGALSQLQSVTAIAGRGAGVMVPLGVFQRTERTLILLLGVMLTGLGVSAGLGIAAGVIILGGLASIAARWKAVRRALPLKPSHCESEIVRQCGDSREWKFRFPKAQRRRLRTPNDNDKLRGGTELGDP